MIWEKIANFISSLSGDNSVLFYAIIIGYIPGILIDILCKTGLRYIKNHDYEFYSKQNFKEGFVPLGYERKLFKFSEYIKYKGNEMSRNVRLMLSTLDILVSLTIVYFSIISYFIAFVILYALVLHKIPFVRIIYDNLILLLFSEI